MGERIDGPREGDANREMVASRETFHGVGAAARSLAHDDRAFLRLQIESEFFASGKGLMGSEYVHRLIDKPWPGNKRSRPELVSLIFVAIFEIVNVRGLPEQIRDHEIDHVGIATMIFPKVKDKGIGICQKIHCRYDCGSADIRRGKRTELDVPDIVTEDFDLRKSTVLIFQHAAKPCLLSRVWLATFSGRTGLLG